MIESTSQFAGLHAAVIMDGNGRWATERGWPRTAGHRAGSETVRRVVRAAPGCGIGILTLYAFSADNWRRPAREVETLMNLFRRFLKREAAECAREGVRLNVIGRRDRLSLPLITAIQRAELLTRPASRLLVRVAVDYSAQNAILGVAQRPVASRDEFLDRMNAEIHSLAGVPEVDLLVRTGGEQRLSDFLLWESSYAELFFTDVLWPDFTGDHLAALITQFRGRDRRFGGLDLGRAG